MGKEDSKIVICVIVPRLDSGPVGLFRFGFSPWLIGKEVAKAIICVIVPRLNSSPVGLFRFGFPPWLPDKDDSKVVICRIDKCCWQLFPNRSVDGSLERLLSFGFSPRLVHKPCPQCG